MDDGSITITSNVAAPDTKPPTARIWSTSGIHGFGALNFLDQHPMRDLARWTVRRLTQEMKNSPDVATALLNRIIQNNREEDVSIILQGMSETLQGWSKAEQPDNWETVYQRWSRTNNPEIAGYLNELAVVFGDGRVDATLMAIAGDETRDIHTRRNALDTLAKAKKASNTPFLQRMLQDRKMSDPSHLETIRSIWPESMKEDLEEKVLHENWHNRLTTLQATHADLTTGRDLFSALCGTCHKLRGTGGDMGPDLTGSDRSNLDYLIENILFPSRVVPDDYRMLRVEMKDGRSLEGLKGPETQSTMVLKTPTQTMVLEKEAIEETTTSKLSLMPEGLLEGLNDQQLRNLFGYLMQ